MTYPEKFGGIYDGGDAVPNSGNPAEGDGTPTFEVPETYVSEGWAKDLKSNEEVWAKLAGAEKLVGQRVEGKVDLPKENASSEDMAFFYKAIGRPEEASGYKFNREGQSDSQKQFNTDEMDNAVRTIFHKYGLRPDQALGIQTDYEALIGKALGEKLEKENANDTDFDAITTKIFGNDKEAIIESSKVLLGKYTPEGLENRVKDFDNETLTVLAGVLNGIKKDYISEDAFKTLGDKTGGGQSEQELRERAKKLMVTEEFTNQFHPKHQERKIEVEEIYKRVSEIE